MSKSVNRLVPTSALPRQDINKACEVEPAPRPSLSSLTERVASVKALLWLNIDMLKGHAAAVFGLGLEKGNEIALGATDGGSLAALEREIVLLERAIPNLAIAIAHFEGHA